MKGKLGCSWLLVGTSLLLACGGDDGTPEGPAKPTMLPSGATCPEGSSLTYGNFAQQFFDDYCTRCHSAELNGPDRNAAPASVNFDTLDDVSSIGAELIDERAVKGGAQAEMPPKEPLPTEEERTKLGEWLACGMP